MVTIGVIKKPLLDNGGGRGNSPISFLELRLIAKGSHGGVPNIDLTTLEIGDFVEGMKDENTKWKSAMYNGGDPVNRANYTPIVEISLNASIPSVDTTTPEYPPYIPPVDTTIPDYSPLDYSPLDYSTT